MANYFDKYDTDVPQAAAAPPPDSNYFDKYDEPMPEVSMQSEDVSSWLERSSKSYGEMGDRMSNVGQGAAPMGTSNMDPAMVEKLGAPTTSPAMQTSEAVSDFIGTTSNVLMDGGLSLIQTILPDDWEDSIKDYSRETWDAISQTPGLRQGIEAAKQGYDVYKEWAKENPEYAQAVGEAVEIGSLGKANPKRLGDTYLKRRAKHNISNRKDATRQLLEPHTKDFTKHNYYEDSRGVITWDPRTWTREVIDEVVRVPEVKPNKSYVHNMNAVRGRAQTFRDELDTLVGTKGKPINTQSVKTGLANKVNNLANETLLTGEPYNKAVLMYRKVDKLLDEADGSALSILNVRRELDDWVASQSKVFDADLNTASSIALKDIRDYLNTQVKDSVKSKKVTTLLERQSKLLTAGDMLETKAMKQADGIVGRIIQGVEKETGVHLPSTPLAQAATVTAAGATLGPAGAATTGLGIAGYKGIKWLFTPDGKAAMAQLARLADSNPLLRPDVNALIAISQGLKPEEAMVDE